MNKQNILRQQATVDSFGGPNAVTLHVTGTFLTPKSVTFSLPRDGQRREPLVPARGGAWDGKNVVLVVLPEEAPRTGFLVGFEVDGDLVFTKPINFKNVPTAKPPQRIPPQQRAAPKQVSAQSKAILGYTQASSIYGNDTVTIRVTSPFVLEIQCRGESRELALAKLEFGRPFRLDGIGNVTVTDFWFQSSLWNLANRVTQPGTVHDFCLEVFAANARHKFWLRSDGATVDCKQRHEGALLQAEKAALGNAGDDLVREISLFSERRQHSQRPQNRPQGQGHDQHHHRPAQQHRPQPPRSAGSKPTAPMQPAPRTSAPPPPPSSKNDGPVSGDGPGTSVVLQLPANSTARIQVEVRDVEGAKPSVTAAAVVCEQPNSPASAPVVEARAITPEPPAAVVLEHSRQPVPVAVEETPPAVDPNSPMGKFLARQARTRKMKEENDRRTAGATPAENPGQQGQVKPKGKSLDELAQELRKS